MKIHHIHIDDHQVSIGATTEERWGWELEGGRSSAVDATDLVWVALTRGRPGMAITETIGLFPGRGTPERAAALQAIPALLDAAWNVIDGSWDATAAHEILYGRELTPTKRS